MNFICLNKKNVVRIYIRLTFLFGRVPGTLVLKMFVLKQETATDVDTGVRLR